MATKKIVNLRTKKAYSIRQRTTSAGRKGQIMGSYSPKRASASVKKNYGDVIRRLSNK